MAYGRDYIMPDYDFDHQRLHLGNMGVEQDDAFVAGFHQFIELFEIADSRQYGLINLFCQKGLLVECFCQLVLLMKHV